MKLTDDLKSPWLIHLKAALFVVLGLGAGTALIAQVPTLRTGALLAVTVWAFCRVYYYLFYVLDRYLGRERRFSGVCDAVRFLVFERAEKKPASLNPDHRKN